MRRYVCGSATTGEKSNLGTLSCGSPSLVGSLHFAASNGKGKVNHLSTAIYSKVPHNLKFTDHLDKYDTDFDMPDEYVKMRN